MEKAKSLADQVIEADKELQEHQNTNNELQYEHEEKMDRLKELYSEYQAKQKNVSK